jgi:recombination protein U
MLFYGEYGILFCLELKTTLSSLTFWKEEYVNKDKNQTFNIKESQIKGLSCANQYKNVIAGFVINFRKVNRTYFLSINQFNEMTKGLNKKSINETDVQNIGAYQIDQTIKRTRYKFNIEKFIDNMQL